MSELRLTIRTPSGTVVDERVASVTAEDGSGRFGIRPNGEAILAVLVPSIVGYRTQKDAPERFAAVSSGVLRFTRTRVRISVRDAVVMESLETLEADLDRASEARGESEAAAHQAIRSLYDSFVVSQLREERNR